MRLALVLVMVWMSVAHANRTACPTVRLEQAHDPIDKTGTRPMPQITALTLSRDKDGEAIWMSGTFDAETASIRLTTSSGYTITTTPKDLWMCSETHVLHDHEHITIVTYDKDGNASEPFESDVTVVNDVPDVEKHPHRDRHGMEVLILIGAIVLSGCIFICLILIGMARKKAPYSVAGELLSPILAENVARLVARGYLIKLAVSLGITLGLATLHHPYIAILVAPFPVVWLFEVFMTRLVLGQFDSKIQRLEKRENWIYINSSKLYAPYKIWEKASALPSATLSSRD